MQTSKIAVSIPPKLLQKLDFYVDQDLFKNRSHALQIAITKIIDRIEHKRLASECKKLNISQEQQYADEGITEDFKEWPEF